MRPTVALVFLLALFFILVSARDFLYPIALGAMLAFLLYPVSSRFERWGLSRALANVIAIVIGIGVVYSLLWFIHHQFSALTSNLPQLKAQVQKNVGGLLQGISRRLGVPMDKERLMSALSAAAKSGPIAHILTATSNTVLAIGLLPVYAFMFLYYRDKFRRFLLMSLPQAKRAVTERIITDVSQVTMHYMAGICGVMLILAVLNTVGFLIIGLNNAVLIGIIAAICALIPYFGNIVGYAIAILFTLVTGASPDMAAYVVLQFFIIQFIENNVLTPNIVGNMVRLSPFFIILGVLGGSLLWGLPGTFVVVPVLAMLKVTFDHLPRYAHWAFLLSDKGTEKEKVTISKLKRLFTFQRKRRK